MDSLVQLFSSPAWVQAIGAIIALAVAIYVPNSLHKKEVARADAERRLKARALAVAIFPELLEIQVKLDRALDIISNKLVTDLGSRVQFHLDQMKIETPPILRSSLDNLYLLGDAAGVPLMQLISVSEQYERLREKATIGIIPGVQLDPSDIKKALQPHLEVIGRLVGEAEQGLHPIHDGTTARSWLWWLFG
jgi:hypothetical protein